MCFFSTRTLYSFEVVIDNFNDGLINFFDNLGEQIDILETNIVNIAKDIDNEISSNIKNNIKNNNKNHDHKESIELSEICIIDSDEDINDNSFTKTPDTSKKIQTNIVAKRDNELLQKTKQETTTSSKYDIFNFYFIEDDSWDIINDIV